MRKTLSWMGMLDIKATTKKLQSFEREKHRNSPLLYWKEFGRRKRRPWEGKIETKRKWRSSRLWSDSTTTTPASPCKRAQINNSGAYPVWTVSFQYIWLLKRKWLSTKVNVHPVKLTTGGGVGWGIWSPLIRGGEFDRELRFHVASRADSTWVDKSWRKRRRKTLMNSKENITCSWRIGYIYFWICTYTASEA